MKPDWDDMGPTERRAWLAGYEQAIEDLARERLRVRQDRLVDESAGMDEAKQILVRKHMEYTESYARS